MVESDKHRARAREKPEPHETNAGIPPYIQMLIVVAILWGIGYILLNPYEREWQAETPALAEAPQVNGEQLYNNNCAACHQATGLGLPGVFPPLFRSEWVVGDARTPVRILLHGLSGEVSVAGVQYNGLMPAFGSMFDDEELAAVASYIRGAWGNDAPPVDAPTVAAERQLHADRATFWAAQELEALLKKP